MVAGTAFSQQRRGSIRVLICGLVHGHAGGIFNRVRGRENVQLVGVVEARDDISQQYAKKFGLDAALFHKDLESALTALKPDIAMAFTNTFDHKRVVEVCAARGVHVMVEKPLAVSMEHCRAIEAAARKGGIQVFVNYETSWYPSVHRLKEIALDEKGIGRITRIVVRDGHPGPKEIGVPPEFLDWLVDPARNGAGALFDFGCYGAGLATWLLGGEVPRTVMAITQNLKPEIYGRVDDDATIVLAYSRAQVVIQASWNWPYSRKDMDVYGTGGYILAPDRNTLLVRRGERAEEKAEHASGEGPYGR